MLLLLMMAAKQSEHSVESSPLSSWMLCSCWPKFAIVEARDFVEADRLVRIDHTASSSWSSLLHLLLFGLPFWLWRCCCFCCHKSVKSLYAWSRVMNDANMYYQTSEQKMSTSKFVVIMHNKRCSTRSLPCHHRRYKFGCRSVWL